MVWLSLVTTVWLFLRAVFYHSKLIPNLSSLMELTLVALVGVVAAIVALLREKEQAWYISIVTMALNAVAWWYTLSQFDWSHLWRS